MNILLIGGGGREHALAWKLAQSPMVESIRVVPGNPGIAGLPKCKCVSLDLNDLNKVADYAEEESIDLTVVGPEAMLVAGIGDVFRSRGLPIFGPNKNAAELEGSKAFSKNLMKKDHIPTAAFKVCLIGWSFKSVLHFAKCSSKAGSPASLPNKEALNGCPDRSPFSFNGIYSKPCCIFPCNSPSTFSVVTLNRESKALYSPKVSFVFSIQ